ncbi:MAG: ATP-binding protein [Chitinophagaceae bacterium]
MLKANESTSSISKANGKYKLSREQQINAKSDQIQEEHLLGHAIYFDPGHEARLPFVKEFSKVINQIVNSITDGFVAIDEHLTVRLWNKVAEKLIGVTKSEISGKKITAYFPIIITSGFYKHFERASNDKVTINVEQYVTPLDVWFDITLYPHDRGLFIYFKDITVRKNQEMLLGIEKNVLEINSRPEATLKGTVDLLLEEIHNIYTNTFCSVILLHEKDQTLRYLSGPALSEKFKKTFNGRKSDSQSGPYAAAINTRKLVMDCDLSKGPIDEFESLPSKSIQSCWSFPIINGRDEVLGSFSCYHTKPLEATQKHLDIFARMAHFLCIIIEKVRAEENVRISNDRYVLATRATNQAIWDWDLKESNIFLGEGFFRLFQYEPCDNIISFDTWKQRIHSTDCEKVLKSLLGFIDNKEQGLWTCEYRFRKAGGDYAFVVDKGYLTFDSEGETIQMIGSMEDVTEKKDFENKLIKEEIEKQKLLARAIIDAQENERAKIGKELHDNVNQVLSTAKLFLEVAKTNSKERINLIGKSAEQIHHAINEIRHISQSLVPPSIGDIGLGESIKDLVQNIAVSKTLEVDYNNVGDIEKNITDNQKVMIFRIIQEQVNNVLKHAEATRISIQLKVDNKEIELTIKDNGKGFDPEKIKTKKGVGLSNIASRVDLFNGKVDIISAPGKGCQLNVKILRTIK